MRSELSQLVSPPSTRAPYALARTLRGKEQRASTNGDKTDGLEGHTLESEPVPGTVKLQIQSSI